MGLKSPIKGQLDFIQGTAVNIGTYRMDVPQNMNIGECLAGIEKFGIGTIESVHQSLVLRRDLFGMINIKGCAKFFCNRKQLLMRQD